MTGRELIYLGGHAAVVVPLPDGSTTVAHRHGAPIRVPDQLASELVSRGDFIEYQPEPPVRPVRTTTHSKE